MILLNVLFVVGYYLYNLLKNPVFWKILVFFVLFCILLFISWFIIHNWINIWYFGHIVWNSLDLEGIKQEFAILKSDIYSIKYIITIKTRYVINFFESYTTNINIPYPYYIIPRLILFFLSILSIFIKNLLKFLRYRYDLTYHYIYFYYFDMFLLRKIIYWFVIILFFIFSKKIYLEIFISFIFNLNPLIFIINVIILLNVFVISYYLYNLLKNTIFWELFKYFITLFIVFIIGLFIVCNINLFISIYNISYLTPEPVEANSVNPTNQANPANPALANLQQRFAAELVDYNRQMDLFHLNVCRLSDNFNNAILYVEFTKDGIIMHFDPTFNEDLKNFCIHHWRFGVNLIGLEANILAQKVNNLEVLDANIHSLSQTEFSNREYQDLSIHLYRYRNLKWLAIQHPNKFLTEMENDLDNQYF